MRRRVARDWLHGLNAAFLGGSPCYDYGAENCKSPPEVIDKRATLRDVADRHDIDLTIAAIQFSAAPDFAVAIVAGAGSDRQIREDWNALHDKIPSQAGHEPKPSVLINADAATPTV